MTWLLVFLVMLLAFLKEVLLPVEFHDQLCLMAVKIRDIGADRLLSLKSNRIILQEIVPKVILLKRRLFTQLLRSRDQISLIRY